jgi:hypothetical protein
VAHSVHAFYAGRGSFVLRKLSRQNTVPVIIEPHIRYSAALRAEEATLSSWEGTHFFFGVAFFSAVCCFFGEAFLAAAF